MNFLSKYLPRTDFDSYEDFRENYRITAPENFNFGYDIVDEYARLEPSKPALIWLNDAGEEKHFTFGDVKEQSDRIANLLCSLGIRKGDRVLLILKQRLDRLIGRIPAKAGDTLTSAAYRSVVVDRTCLHHPVFSASAHRTSHSEAFLSQLSAYKPRAAVRWNAEIRFIRYIYYTISYRNCK